MFSFVGRAQFLCLDLRKLTKCVSFWKTVPRLHIAGLWPWAHWWDFCPLDSVEYVEFRACGICCHAVSYGFLEEVVRVASVVAIHCVLQIRISDAKIGWNL